MNKNNSRRGFLSSLAILSAGTVLAGNPSKLFLENDEQLDLEKTWNDFIKKTGARVFLNPTGFDLPVKNTDLSGHKSQKGTIIHFDKENLLAQPTWIYWANSKAKPADVIINIYENSFPYNRVVALNRYQIHALLELSKKISEENLLQAACCKNDDEKYSGPKLKIKTTIKKRKQSQDICFYKNNSLIFKEKLFYNV